MPTPEESRREYMRAYMKARRAAERDARLAAGEEVRRGRPRKKMVRPGASRRASRVHMSGVFLMGDLESRGIREIPCHQFRRLIEQEYMFNCRPITRDEIVRAVFEWAKRKLVEMPEFSRRGWPKMLRILPEKASAPPVSDGLE